MRRDVKLNGTIDTTAARLLALLAEREAESNRSLMLRRIIREAAERRGLKLPEARPAELAEVRP